MIRGWLQRPVAAGGLAFVVIVVTLLTYYAAKFGLNVAPSSSGDEISYDVLGWNLSQGRGFCLGGVDSSFLAPYRQAEPDHSALLQLYTEPAAPIAFRPPLFPSVIAGTNLLLGRQFWGVRLGNVLATAATGALLVWYVARSLGSGTALLTFILFLFVDTRTRLYGRTILTEPLATFLLTVLCLLFLAYRRTGRLKTVLVIGVCCSLAVLARSVFVLWLPGLALLLGSLSLRHHSGTMMRRIGFAVGRMSWLTAVVCLLLLPWAARNIAVTERLMPLGTQGMMQLSAGFSDQAVQQRGVWQLDAELQIREELELETLTPVQQEVAVAERSRQQALAWICAHPEQSVGLAGHKIWQEYRPRSAAEWLLLTIAGLGLWLGRRRPDIRLWSLFHLINCLAIACTWSVEGRFVVPLQFTVHVFAASALAFPLNRAGNLQ